MLLVILLGTAVLLFLGWLRLVRRRKPAKSHSAGPCWGCYCRWLSTSSTC